MDDKEFDKYIREQLSNKIVESPNDWEDMQQKLVDESIIEEKNSDTDLDEMFKNHLDQATVPFNDNHWVKLREKLITEKYLRRRLAVAKILELSVLLLFLMAILGKIPIKSELYAVHKYRPYYKKIAQVWKPNIEEVVTTTTGKKTNYLGDFDVKYSWPLTTDRKEEKKESIDKTQSITPLSNSIDYLETLKREIYPPKHIYLEKPISFAKEKIVTASAGFGVNNIRTPFTNEAGTSEQSFNDIGRQASITYGIRHGKTEIYTGLGVNKASYNPAIQNGVFDSYQGDQMEPSKIRNISYLLLHIPIGLRFHQIQKESWSIYTSGAINMGLLAKSEHKFDPLSKDDLKEMDLNSISSFAEGNSQVRNTLNSDLTKGILQRGNFLDNFSLSATIGVGLVKSVSEKMSFYIEPSYTYNFSFDGIGVHNEEINNYKINLGIRYIL